MNQSRWYVLIIICLAQIFCATDNAIMINALAALVKSFGCSMAAIELANSIYPLMAGALMLTSGLLGLKIGWKKLLCVGLFIAAIGEVAAVFSPNVIVFTWLGRMLVGLGASMVIPAVLGLIPTVYGGRDLAISFGVVGAASGVAAAFSPIVGGWIIDRFSWQVAFLFMAISLGLVFWGALKIKKKASLNREIKFDYLGAVLFAVSMLMILLSLLKIGQWNIDIIVLVFGAGLAVLVFFGIYEHLLEKKQGTVLLPSIYLRTGQVVAGLAMTALIFFVFGGMSFVLVAYLQVVLGLNALLTGLALMTFSLGLIFFSFGTPIIIKDPNPRRICQIGILLTSLSCFLVAFAVGLGSLNLYFIVGIFILGAANGLLSSQAGVIVTDCLPEDSAAQSGGIQGSMRGIGQAVGIALVGAIMAYSLTQIVHGDLATNPKAIQITLLSFSLIVLLFYIFTFSIPTSTANQNLKEAG
ncbi:MAG: MFS transporter [Candidatus Margulisbacteria bacterium]|nr:MFS transporter [Candidatus Margulisiibacteriota bacterium]